MKRLSILRITMGTALVVTLGCSGSDSPTEPTDPVVADPVETVTDTFEGSISQGDTSCHHFETMETADITMQLNAKAKDFGIEVLDVRLKRADLPEANSEAIYNRMKTERQREAAEIRAEGEEQARRIRADGDRQVTVLKANATRDSEKIRGDGDAKRNAIFADAFGRDPDFFAFYRSMQAYEAGLGSSDTRLVLTPDTEFFRYFNDPAGQSTRAAEKKR